MKVICPYCLNEAKLVSSIETYGKDYGWQYRCYDCKAYVGCHKGTKKALGSLAKKELRQLRIRAHELFDDIWKNSQISRTRARKRAYERLAKRLYIPYEACHFSWFNEETCKRAIEILEAERSI